MISLVTQFITNNWKQVLFATLVGSNVLLFRLWRHEANSFSEYEAKVVAEQKAQSLEADTIINEQKQITKETTDGWKAAVDYLHANPQRVLSRYCTGSGVSLTAPGTDGSIESTVPTAPRIEEDAADTVLELNRLQDWIEAQLKATKRLEGVQK